MMAQKSLSNLIKFCIIFIISIQIAIAFIIDDFEDVSDWTCRDDCSAFVTDSGTKLFGSFSGKATFVQEVDGTGELRKLLSSPVNYVNQNISLWFFLDSADWGSGRFGITLLEVTNPCIDGESIFIDQNNTWEHLNTNITTFGTYSAGFCDAVDQIRIEKATDEGITGTADFFLDENPCDASIVIGDMLIDNAHICTLNTTEQISGNLNLTNGSLEIQYSDILTVSGGLAYIYPQSNLTIIGQING